MGSKKSQGSEATARGLTYLIAQQYALIGETEEAMTWLECANEERDPLQFSAKTDPRFEDLPRLIDLPES